MSTGPDQPFAPPESPDGHGEDSVFRASLSCPEQFEGGPGVAHGGWVCAVLDEFLGRRLSVLHGGLAITADLQVTFLKPVPVGRALEGVGHLERRDGRRCRASGFIRLASTGTVLARASGVWSIRGDEHWDRHQRWLAAQDADVRTTPAQSLADG